MTERVRLADGTDDVEEEADGTLLEASNDLDFADGVIIGLRYDVCIPRGATVTEAFLSFAADEPDTLETSATIWAERTDDASPFDDSLPSERTRTTSSVEWAEFNEWTVSTVEDSPDLSVLLNEVISDPAWTGCGHIVFIIESTGDREAVSFDNAPGRSARLEFTYQP